MKISGLILLTLSTLIYSCAGYDSSGGKNIDHLDTTRGEGKSNEAEPEMNDCVFDTSAYKFTTEALQNYKADIPFYWDKKDWSAIAVLDNGDTLVLSIGGCNHFGYSATLHSSIHFDKTSELINKAHWLATTFFSNGFDKEYDRCLSSGKYELDKSTDADIKSYTIITGDTIETNMIYEGFAFFRNGERTKIVISGYIN